MTACLSRILNYQLLFFEFCVTLANNLIFLFSTFSSGVNSLVFDGFTMVGACAVTVARAVLAPVNDSLPLAYFNLSALVFLNFVLP